MQPGRHKEILPQKKKKIIGCYSELAGKEDCVPSTFT